MFVDVLCPYFYSYKNNVSENLASFKVLLSNDTIQKIYTQIVENLNLRQNKNAIFLCDKLVSLTNGHILSVLLLA